MCPALSLAISYYIGVFFGMSHFHLTHPPRRGFTITPSLSLTCLLCAGLDNPVSGFLSLTMHLPFIWSLSISQSCIFGVNLCGFLNTAHLSFWIISSTLTAFQSFFKRPPRFSSLCQGAWNTGGILSVSVWWLTEWKKLPFVLLLLVCFFPCWAVSSVKSGDDYFL